ncbi:FAD:protein FMN transferase, partial [Alienimonas chondri]|uniref:FAD:protein FMN transferase n=1 Tax=Alienimonas chondri TaxID=2681879 RepID=UPI001489DEC6
MSVRKNAEAPRSLGVLCLLVLVAAGCGPLADAPPEPAVVRWQGQTMGTTYSVAIAELPEGISADWLKARIDAELQAVNRQMSTWDPESELSRFNASQSTDWFDVSPETAAVTALALEIAADSGGAFDPTVGPLVDLWGFGDGARPIEAPSDQVLAETRAHVGYEKLHVRDDPPALRKDIAGLRVNLSAIAKGHGVDRVADALEAAELTNYLVEIGGEVRAAGVKANG